MAPHILIIDADRSAAQVTGAVLRRIAPDATLRYASTPYQGWLVAHCAVPDVLVIDPGVHGAASTLLIQLCKQSWPLMRIAVLTLVRTPAKQIGADVHIDKSVAAPALVQNLRAIIEQATSARRTSLPTLHPAPAASIKDGAVWTGAHL